MICIEPYGKFDVFKIGKPDIKNCRVCWFGQTNNGIHHCPENHKCVIDGVAYVFIKIPDNLELPEKPKEKPRN